jgi:hypothetical protein
MTAVIVVMVLVAYWIPTFIALIRNVPHIGSILAPQPISRLNGDRPGCRASDGAALETGEPGLP